VDSHFEWKSGFELHTAVNFTQEGLVEPFEIAEGVVVPPGRYEHAETQIVVITNQAKPLSLDSRFILGGFFGGHRFTMTPIVKARHGEQLNLELGYEFNNVDLPGGSFETNLVKARLSWSWTPRLFIQGLVQYNDQADLWSANLRFGWLRSANTGLFVVYNENRDVRDSAWLSRDRSVTVKWSQLFDLLD
jgi:hypothetical protein